MQLGFHTLVYRNTYGETHHSEVFSNDSDTITRLEERYRDEVNAVIENKVSYSFKIN